MLKRDIQHATGRANSSNAMKDAGVAARFIETKHRALR